MCVYIIDSQIKQPVVSVFNHFLKQNQSCTKRDHERIVCLCLSVSHITIISEFQWIVVLTAPTCIDSL